MDRKTIGLLINEIEMNYVHDLWTGISQRCAELDFNFITIVGAELKHPLEWNASRNNIYQLATEMDLDGVLISSTLGYFVSDAELTTFIQQFTHKPTVLLGFERLLSQNHLHLSRFRKCK
ncbi:MAG: hypothetical protein AAF639_24805 [Chloroflexota bacterium]